MKFYHTIAIAVIQACCLQLAVAQLITFKDGKIGVNFMGYHASAGLGGGSNGGFLSAEAGTPYGPAARAGLGGGMNNGGRLGGNLYADATAGGGISARAGLGGALDGSDSPKAAGEIYSGAQVGPSIQAGAGLHGQTVGGHKSHTESHVYSEHTVGNGVNGGQTVLRASVGGSDGPPREVIYKETVHAVPPSPGRQVYKVNTKLVSPSGGVVNRYNADEEDSSSEGDVNSQVQEQIYYGQGVNGGVNGVRTEVSSSIGSDVPSGHVTYTKTVQASAPSPGRQVYKVTNVVTPSGGVVNRYNTDEDFNSEGGHRSHTESHVYSEHTVLDGVHGGETVLRSSVSGSDGPPREVIYKETVHAVPPSPGRQVYKVNTKLVSPSGGVVNRYNADEEDSSSEEDEEKVQAPVRKVNSGGKTQGNFNAQVSLGGQIGGPTQFVSGPPTNGATEYVSKNKVRTEHYQGNQNEVAGGPSYGAPNNGYVENSYQPFPPAPVGGNFVHVEKYIETEPRPIVYRRPHHHHRKHGYKYITRYVDTQNAAPPPPPSLEVTGAASGGIDSGVTYEKRVQLGNRSGTFFDDIFNIPISALKAVNGFLSNNVPKGNIEVHKSVYTN